MCLGRNLELWEWYFTTILPYSFSHNSMAKVNPLNEASVTFILDPFVTCLWEDLLVIGCGWKWVSIYDLSIKFTKTTVGAMAMMAFSPISMNGFQNSRSWGIQTCLVFDWYFVFLF